MFFHRSFMIVLGVILLATCSPNVDGQERVMTIFCQGTGGHRNGRDLELITELSAAYWNRGSNETPNSFYVQNYQKTFLILDGVGKSDMFTTLHGPKTIGVATELYPEGETHAMPGDFKPNSFKKPKKQPPSSRVSQMKYFLSRLNKGPNEGDIMGVGWDDNVAHALFVLKALRMKNQFPTKINMIGWSRGAVTCIKLANAIDDYFVDGKPYKMLKDPTGAYSRMNMEEFYPALPSRLKVKKGKIELNLFLIDPVPGRFGATGEAFGSKRSEERFPPTELDYQSLPTIVNDCIVTLALDERRAGFAALDQGKAKGKEDIKFSSSKTNVVWLPFPGIHRTQVRLDPRDPVDDSATRAQLNKLPLIVWDLAWRFLKENGTKFQRQQMSNGSFDGTKQLANDDVVDLYANLWLLRKEYHDARNSGMNQRIQGFFRPRDFTGYSSKGHQRADLFTAELGAYVLAPGFFINEHHRACFEIGHPELYQFLMKKPSKKIKIKRGGKNVSVYEDPTNVLTKEAGSALCKQLEKLGMFLQSGKTYVPADFRFGSKLGEALVKNKRPAKSRYKGSELIAMGVISPPQLPPSPKSSGAGRSKRKK